MFVIWIASTVYAFDQADPDYDADLREVGNEVVRTITDYVVPVFRERT